MIKIKIIYEKRFFKLNLDIAVIGRLLIGMFNVNISYIDFLYSNGKLNIYKKIIAVYPLDDMNPFYPYLKQSGMDTLNHETLSRH